MKSIPVAVRTPSGYVMTVRSIRAAARMLSGYGTESGGLRSTISRKALNGLITRRVTTDNVVRNNALFG